MKKLLLIFALPFICGVTIAQELELTPMPKQTEPRDGIYDYVDEPAEFPGGMPALRKFLSDNLKYPESALKDSLEGKSYVKLLISDIGEVQNAKIFKSFSDYPEFDKEALRVMYLMPKWKPAKVNGKNVSSYYRIPVTFKLP